MLKNIIIFTFITFIYSCSSGIIPEKETNIPDDSFRVYLKSIVPNAFNIDFLDKDSEEVKNLTILSISVNTSIHFLDGLSYFTGLKQLSIEGTPNVTSLDLSSFSLLTNFRCINTNVSNISFENNVDLKTIELSANEDLKILNISNLKELTTLNCSNSYLKSIQFNVNNSLSYINCSNNEITTLNLSSVNSLENLICFGNEISTIDIRSSNRIKVLDVKATDEGSNPISKISIHEDIKQSEPIKALKLSRGEDLKIIVYDSEGTKICENYIPETDGCM